MAALLLRFWRQEYLKGAGSLIGLSIPDIQLENRSRVAKGLSATIDNATG
jgi:hypothetical protein